LGLLRAIPILENEAYLAGLALLAAVAALALRRRATPAGEPPATSKRAGFGIAAGLLVLVPWLWFGAAGGSLETILAALAAAAVGWLATSVLDAGFWAPWLEAGRARLVVLGGLVAGVALLLVGAGVGAAGPHLSALLILPALGFAAAALAPHRRAALAGLVAVAVFGPLALVDPEEVTLLLVGRDVPLWTAVATGASLAVALLTGVVYAVVLARRTVRSGVAAATAIGMAVVAGVVYVGLGQPGLYGDRLFVVLRDQADLSSVTTTGPGATGQAGRDTRVRAVYQLLVAHAERTQAGLRHELDRLHVGYRPYYLVNGIEVDGGGPALRAWLSRRDDVDRVLLSQRLRPVPSAPEPMRGSDPAPGAPPWNITLLGADQAWTELRATGAGITVGTSDSGVDGAHPALAAGFRGGDDSWYDPWNGTRTPTDHEGHGTHTLGTAVGRTNVGVAPDARWVGCVNLDRNLGNPARYLDCLQFMLAPFPAGGDPFTDGRPERAPHVLTNSWGCPPLEGCDAGALHPATAALATAGIFFVAAAGNTGPYCDSIDDPPAPYAEVLTVGAVDRQRRVTDFSSRGPTPDRVAKPDVVAPGAEVLSALPGGGYGELAGTSMATPHVAGVVALMWSANPALIGDLARTRDILRETAAPAQVAPGADSCGDSANLTGAGVVDAYAAVKASRPG
jgi:subtilase family protein